MAQIDKLLITERGENLKEMSGEGTFSQSYLKHSELPESSQLTNSLSSSHRINKSSQ